MHKRLSEAPASQRLRCKHPQSGLYYPAPVSGEKPAKKVKIFNFSPRKCAKFEFQKQLNSRCKKARIKRRKTQNQKLMFPH